LHGSYGANFWLLYGEVNGVWILISATPDATWQALQARVKRLKLAMKVGWFSSAMADSRSVNAGSALALERSGSFGSAFLG